MESLVIHIPKKKTETETKQKRKINFVFLDENEEDFGKEETKVVKKSKKKEFNGIKKADYEKFMDTIPSLEKICSMIKKIKGVNAATKKVEIVKTNIDCVKFWYYVMHPYYHFGFESDYMLREIPSFVYSKVEGLMNDNGEYIEYPKNLFELLDLLRKRKVTGEKAKKFLFNFMYENEKYRFEIVSIVDKNLKIGFSEKRVNQVFEDLIPEFNVALGIELSKALKKPDFRTEQWFVSRKFDGICVLAFIEKDKPIEFHTRSGRTMYCLTVLENKLNPIKKILDGFVLHGELCIIDLEGNEDFKNIKDETSRKNWTIPNPKFLIFDMIKVDDFWKSHSEDTFAERQELLHSKFNEIQKIIPLEEKFSNYFEVVKQELINNEEVFKKWKTESEMNNWEGLMLRKATESYEGKRSQNMIKIKKNKEEEFKCIKMDAGMKQILNQETKVMESVYLMSNIYIDLGNDNQCSVGSGFSDAQRIRFLQHPEEIIGKMITIQHYGLSKNQKSGISLRMPTFKCVRDDICFK